MNVSTWGRNYSLRLEFSLYRFGSNGVIFLYITRNSRGKQLSQARQEQIVEFVASRSVLALDKKCLAYFTGERVPVVGLVIPFFRRFQPKSFRLRPLAPSVIFHYIHQSHTAICAHFDWHSSSFWSYANAKKPHSNSTRTDTIADDGIAPLLNTQVDDCHLVASNGCPGRFLFFFGFWFFLLDVDQHLSGKGNQSWRPFILSGIVLHQRLAPVGILPQLCDELDRKVVHLNCHANWNVLHNYMYVRIYITNRSGFVR